MVGNPRVPPRFVPTLTAVLGEAVDPVRPATEAQPPAVALTEATRDAIALRPGEVDAADAFQLEEQLLHRVLQRIDLQLEERLSDVVAAAVQQQLDSMVPRLREEIEGVLRTLVVESLAQELSENTGSVPPSAPDSLG